MTQRQVSLDRIRNPMFVGPNFTLYLLLQVKIPLILKQVLLIEIERKSSRQKILLEPRRKKLTRRQRLEITKQSGQTELKTKHAHFVLNQIRTRMDFF